MYKIKVVIGANYGDEGKGLMTDYFAKEATEAKERAICICSNGGAQRGHTVELPSGERHVFHHFSSGTFRGVNTYIAPQYMVNPIIFCEELKELKEKFNLRPTVYVNENCRVTTIYDVLLNRLIEEQRGNDKHGSCGLGIYETFNRNKTRYGFTLRDIWTQEHLYTDNLVKYLQLTKEFFEKRAIDLKIPKDKYQPILDNKQLFHHYAEDVITMCQNINRINNPYLFLENDDTIIIENAQGLLLDMDNEGVNKTPSNTGLKNLYDCIPSKIIENSEIEVCYVTRVYMTRHGAGDLPTECNPYELNPNEDISFNDLTNVPNPYQDKIRYGKLDNYQLIKRIDKDLTKNFPTCLGIELIKTLALTHYNEIPHGEILSFYRNNFNSLYISNSKYANDIYKI